MDLDWREDRDDYRYDDDDVRRDDMDDLLGLELPRSYRQDYDEPLPFTASWGTGTWKNER